MKKVESKPSMDTEIISLNIPNHILEQIKKAEKSNEKSVEDIIVDALENTFSPSLRTDSANHANNVKQDFLSIIFDGYLLLDAENNILDVNSTYCEMVGYEHAELLQMNVSEIEVIGTNEQIHADEAQFRHKDGSLIDVEIRSIPLPNNHIKCFIRNISQHKNLEHQLKHSLQLYQGLVESQIDLVCRYTPDTTLTYVNDAYCQYFGRKREELIGTSFSDTYPRH